jgi:hypothetical protein
LTGYDVDFIFKYRGANADFKILQNFNADFGLPTSSVAREYSDEKIQDSRFWAFALDWPIAAIIQPNNQTKLKIIGMIFYIHKYLKKCFFHAVAVEHFLVPRLQPRP